MQYIHSNLMLVHEHQYWSKCADPQTEPKNLLNIFMIYIVRYHVLTPLHATLPGPCNIFTGGAMCFKYRSFSHMLPCFFHSGIVKAFTPHPPPTPTYLYTGADWCSDSSAIFPFSSRFSARHHNWWWCTPPNNPGRCRLQKKYKPYVFV